MFKVDFLVYVMTNATSSQTTSLNFFWGVGSGEIIETSAYILKVSLFFTMISFTTRKKRYKYEFIRRMT